MHKRKLFYAMCCLTAVLAIGCGKKDSTDTKNPEQVESQDTTKTDDENKSDTKNDTEQTDDKKEESEKTKSVMKIYSINMSSGEIQTEDVETDSTEDLFCLLDVPILEMPDLAGTMWDEFFQSERRREDDRS